MKNILNVKNRMPFTADPFPYPLRRRFGLPLAISGTSIFSYSPNRCSTRSRSVVKPLRR